MKEKISVILGAIIGITVFFGVVFYINAIQKVELYDLILIIIPIILVLGVIFLLRDKIKNIKAGLPSDDERAKKLQWKAGTYTYFATIWIAVGIMWYNIFAENSSLNELNTKQVIAAIVLLSAVCFFILNFYFMRKGDVQ